MSNSDPKKNVPFTLNLMIIVTELIGFFHVIYENGFALFTYYTWDSNIILLVSSVLIIVDYYCPLKNRSFLEKLNYMAVVLVTITLLIVIFVLLPMVIPDGKSEIHRLLFSPANFFHHLVCPILALFSFFLTKYDCKIKIKDSLLPSLSSIIYAVILLILNFTRIIDGPYPFLHVHDQSILYTSCWMISLYVFTIMIGIGMMFLHNLKQKKQ